MWYFHFEETAALYFILLNLVLKLHGMRCLQGTVYLTLLAQVDYAPEWKFVAAVLIQRVLEVKYLNEVELIQNKNISLLFSHGHFDFIKHSSLLAKILL